MTQAERDPSVLVSATLARNEKMIALPNDRARLGWVYLLGAAKLRRPAGEFACRAVLAADLGWYDRFTDDYVTTGLIHVAPLKCDACQERWPALPDGRIVVHDWHRHQRSPADRVREWRDENGIPSGHVTLSGKQAGHVRGNDGENIPTVSPLSPESYPSRAGLRASQLHSLSPSILSEEGGPGETDDGAIDTYCRLVAVPSPNALRWLHEMVSEFGDDRVSRALASETLRDRNPGDLLKRTKGRLRRDADKANEAERERKAREFREAEEHRARRVLDEPWRKAFAAAVHPGPEGTA